MNFDMERYHMTRVLILAEIGLRRGSVVKMALFATGLYSMEVNTSRTPLKMSSILYYFNIHYF
jgi:hypothetical protein